MRRSKISWSVQQQQEKVGSGDERLLPAPVLLLVLVPVSVSVLLLLRVTVVVTAPLLTWLPPCLSPHARARERERCQEERTKGNDGVGRQSREVEVVDTGGGVRDLHGPEDEDRRMESQSRRRTETMEERTRWIPDETPNSID